MTSIYHTQSEESYLSIPDEPLRKFVRQAVIRASALDWPLFVALHYPGPERVNCFDAALPMPLSEFLCGCANYAFPRGPSDPAERTRPEFTEVADRTLRAALENADTRALDLDFLLFIDLFMDQPGRVPREIDFCAAGYLASREIFAHLHQCFLAAILASFGSDRDPGGRGRAGEPFAN